MSFTPRRLRRSRARKRTAVADSAAEPNAPVATTSTGAFFVGGGDQLELPLGDARDWTEHEPPAPNGTPVMCLPIFDWLEPPDFWQLATISTREVSNAEDHAFAPYVIREYRARVVLEEEEPREPPA